MRIFGDGRHIATAVKVWFVSLKKSSQFAISVGLVHLAAILWMGLDHCLSNHPKALRPIVVRTIRPEQAPIQIAQATKLAQVSSPIAAAPYPSLSPPKPQNQTASAPRPYCKSSIDPPAVPAKGVKINPQRSSKKIVQHKTIRDQTIKEIEDGLDAIALVQPPKKTASAEIALPALIQHKTSLSASIEENITITSVPSTYHLCLIDQLQGALQLPEWGAVRVKITLSAPGTISSMQILDAKSEKNAEWLRKQLPLLSLPCFNDFGIVDAFLEFTITFCNVENS
jgi:hypothetical protein